VTSGFKSRSRCRSPNASARKARPTTRDGRSIRHFIIFSLFAHCWPVAVNAGLVVLAGSLGSLTRASVRIGKLTVCWPNHSVHPPQKRGGG
jgi:hypothetical protein